MGRALIETNSVLFIMLTMMYEDLLTIDLTWVDMVNSWIFNNSSLGSIESVQLLTKITCLWNYNLVIYNPVTLII